MYVYTWRNQCATVHTYSMYKYNCVSVYVLAVHQQKYILALLYIIYINKEEFGKRLCVISSRGRNQIATKPSQRFGIHTVECPRGCDDRKYALAEERAAKNQKTTVRHFGCTEKVYGLPCTVRTLLLWKRHHRTPSWELT